MVLRKDGEDRLGQVCEKLIITKNRGGEKYPTYNTKKEG